MAGLTADEAAQALAEAARLREQGEDLHHLGHLALDLQHRVEVLEAVYTHARRYLHSGEGAQEHAALVRALEQAEAALRDPAAAPRDIKPW